VRRLFEEHRFTARRPSRAESHVDRSIADPLAFLQTTCSEPLPLMKAACDAMARGPQSPTARSLHVSTDDGLRRSLGVTDPAFTESSPYRPNSPYAGARRRAINLYGRSSRLTGCRR